jgi:hypothetical protein
VNNEGIAKVSHAGWILAVFRTETSDVADAAKRGLYRSPRYRLTAHINEQEIRLGRLLLMSKTNIGSKNSAKVRPDGDRSIPAEQRTTNRYPLSLQIDVFKQHVMSLAERCSCGIQEEQKRSVRLDRYEAIHVRLRWFYRLRSARISAREKIRGTNALSGGRGRFGGMGFLPIG